MKMKREFSAPVLVLTAALFLPVWGGKPGVQKPPPGIPIAPSGQNIRIDTDYGKMPIYFIPNRGQLDKPVAYYVQGKDKTLYFTEEGITFALIKPLPLGEPPTMPGAVDSSRSLLQTKSKLPEADLKTEKAAPSPVMGRGLDRGPTTTPERWVIKLEFVGANPVQPIGEAEAGAVVSYFKEKPEDWHAGLPTYSKITYRDLWPGIDIIGSFGGTVDFGLDFGATDIKTSSVVCTFITKLELDRPDTTTPRHAVGDFDWDYREEVGFDFGTAGIWLYDQGNWTQLAPENPESLLGAKVKSGPYVEIMADLGSQGLWMWENGTWLQLSAADVETMTTGLVMGGSDSVPAFVGDFGGSGIWRWNHRGWQWVAGTDPDSVIMAKIQIPLLDWTIGDFGAAGLWEVGGRQLSGANADQLTKGRLSVTERLIADFGPLGLWVYFLSGGWDSYSWRQLTGSDPDFVIAADVNADGIDEIAADFGPAGLWLWDTQWTALSGANPESMIAADVTGDGSDEIAVDFGAAGLWVWNNGPWSQITTWNPECLLAADTNGDGAKEILADFGASGLWMWNGAWSQLSANNPD